MADNDTTISDEEQEEVEEQSEEKKKAKEPEEISQETIQRRKKIKKFLLKVEKFIVIIIAIGLLLFSPYFIIKLIEKNKKPVVEDYVFQFPEVEKESPKKTFEFKTGARNETKVFQVKLNDKITIIRTQIYLAFDGENSDLSDEIEQRRFQIDDRIQYYLSTKGYYDLNTAEKREFTIKKELVNEINSILNNGKIQDIFFTQFFISRNRSTT